MIQDENNKSISISRIFKVFGLAFLICFIWIVGNLIIHFLDMIWRNPADLLDPISAFLIFAYTFIFGLVFWTINRNPSPLKIIGLDFSPRCFKDCFAGFLYGVIGVFIALVIIHIFGKVEIRFKPANIVSPESIGPFNIFPGLIMLLLYAGQEEILGRGVLYPLFRKYLGIIAALFLSSLIFSTLHFLNPNFSIYAAIDIFLAGIFLALLREISGNLFLAWGAHLGWNFTLAFFSLPVSGIWIILQPLPFHLVISGPDIVTGSHFGPEGGISGIITNLILVVVAAKLLTEKKKREQATEGSIQG